MSVIKCDICAEDVDTLASCIKCGYNACEECVKRYILENSITEPHCMKCKIGWKYEFMIDRLGSKFINGAYAKHCKRVLIEREKSRLEDAFLHITNEKKIRTLRLQASVVREDLKEITKQLKNRLADINRTIRELRNESKNKNEPRRGTRIIMRCTIGECKGFVTSEYKCGVCDTYVCKKCHESRGTDMSSKEYIDHVCDNDTVESIKCIQSETKPCPKCGVSIFKISGCNQMWCTMCKVAFDWKKGDIITNETIHNPHYYEYMRSVDKDPNIRKDNCEVVKLEEYISIVNRAPQEYRDLLINIHHFQAHYSHIVETIYITDNDNSDLRIRYLKGSIDDDRFERILLTRERTASRYRQIHDVLEMTINVIKDIIRRIVSDMKNIPTCLVEIHTLRKYVNENLNIIRNRYNGYVVPCINEDWVV